MPNSGGAGMPEMPESPPVTGALVIQSMNATASPRVTMPR